MLLLEYDEDGVRVETRGRKRLQYPEWYEGFSWDDPVEVAWTVGHWRRGHVGLKRKRSVEQEEEEDADTTSSLFPPNRRISTKFSHLLKNK